MIIRFKNWEEFQNNKLNGSGNLVEKTSWFKFYTSVIFNEVWTELDDSEFRVFIFSLCQASLNRNKGFYRYSDRIHDRMSGIDKSVFHRAFKKLKSLQVIEIRAERGRYASAASDYPRLEEKREEEIRLEEKREILADSAVAEPRRVFDFDALYKKYPRKEGKQKGLLTCKAQIKTLEDYECLDLAIGRYVAHIAKNATEPRFIKQFSTFMTSWRDWLDSETGTVQKPKAEEPEWKRLAREEEDRHASKRI